MTTQGRIDVQAVKQAAAGRGVELLEYTAHIPRDILDGKPHPCPLCGGKDRFRMIDPDAGSAFCNQCFNQKNGDFLAAIQHFRKVDFQTALAESAFYLGLSSTPDGYGQHAASASSGADNGNGQAKDPLVRMAERKRCPIDSLKVYGGGSKPEQAVAGFPMYDGNGKQCSTFLCWPDSSDEQRQKGLNSKGKPAGLFLPHDSRNDARLPQAGETWVLVEGVKDAAALHGLGYLALGLPGKSVKNEWLTLFRDVHVRLCLDNDQAGLEATPKLQKKLTGAGVASLAAIKLPAAGDVRDNAAAVGADTLKAAIDGAEPPERPAFSKLIPFDDFLATEFPDDELIPGVLVAGQPGVVGARLKCMKSHVACELAISLASQTDFCGHFHVARQCRVGLWSGESGRKKVQRILRAQRDTHDIRDPIPLFVSFALPKLSMADHLSVLHEVITANRLDVVIIDPLYMALLDASNAGLAGNVYAMGVILEPLSSLGQETNCTIATCHHFKKNAAVDQEEPCSLEELSQAGVAEWAGQWILLARRTPYASDGRHELFMRVGGRSGHASFWGLDIDEGDPSEGADGQRWDVGIRPITDVRTEAAQAKEQKRIKQQEERDNEDCRKMLQAVRRCPEGDTQTQLAKLAGLNGTRGATAIRTLLGEGRIERIEIKKHTKVETGYVATGK